MARPSKSKFISPQKRSASTEEEAEESEDNSELGSGSDAGAANDGKTHHLASSLPDAPSQPDDAEDSDDHATPHFNRLSGNMGNADSKEVRNQAIRDTSDELLRRNGNSTSTARVSTGKLIKPSARTTKPAYSNRSKASAARQRQLPPTNTARRSEYDELDDSPAKGPPPKARWTEQPPQFSPTKKQLKKAQQMDAQHVIPAVGGSEEGTQAVVESPRRSRRQQQAQEQEVEVNATPWRGDKRQPKAAQSDTGGEMNEDDQKYKDLFPDTVVQRYQDESADAEAGAGAEEAGPSLDVAEESSAVADRDETVNNQNNIGAKGAQTPSLQKSHSLQKDSAKPAGDPSPAKRGRGRPKKSTLAADESAVPTTEHRTPRRSAQVESSKNPDASDASATGGSPRQTRAQKAASQSPQKQKSAQRVFPAENNTEMLRARQLQNAEEEDQDQRTADEDQAEVPDDDERDDDRSKELFVANDPSPQRPVAAQRAAVVQLEELGYGDESDDDPPRPRISKKRKESPTEQSTKANTRVKRTGFAPAENGGNTEAGPASNQSPKRLFGQWRKLQEILRDLGKVGCRVIRGEEQEQQRIALTDEDVKATMELCKEASARFERLKGPSREPEALQDPASVLEEIGERIDGLCGWNDEFPRDLKDSNKCTDIYFHLIPALVRLVRDAILCYESSDRDEVQEGETKIPHLLIVNEMILLILNLGKAAKKYDRPSSEDCVVRPVERHILPPLQDVRSVFNRYLKHHDDMLRQTQLTEQEASERALRLEQDERRSQQQANLRHLRDKWQKLHEERMWAEGGIMSSRKRAHLRMPEHHIEMDQNGMPFERTEVFIPRIGPPPGLVDEALAQEWSMVELSTLCDGLKQYTGINVFERIFRKYCRQGRGLNRYNVTEIVSVAAGMRERLVESQKSLYGDVEEWIVAIPVWTKGHHALGKENEDRAVVGLAEEG